MGMYNKIVIGERNGSRVVISRHESSTSRRPKYVVRCDCGREQIVPCEGVRGKTACKKCHPGGARRKYGDDRKIGANKLYHSWIAMRRRCDPDVDSKRNDRWAGRGIRVCAEWQSSFEAFEKWSLAHGYEVGLSLDRVDSDGDYSPTNCEWVTRAVNSKRCRAQYHFVRKMSMVKFYDEACYGDF